MEKFIMSLLFCSAEMSAVSVVYIGLLRALKNRQLPVLRYYSWLVICPSSQKSRSASY